MAPRKLRQHQAGTAVTAPASPAAPAAAAAAPAGASVGASTARHAAAAASDPGSRLLEVSDTVDNLLACPDSSLLEGTGIADACKVLDQLFAQPSSASASASADQQQKHLAVRALHQLKLPHLVAKLLSSSSTQPDGQLTSSKWQQPGYCRSITALLEAYGQVFRRAEIALLPAGQQQHEDVMQAGVLLLQSGVLQQVILAQQQLAELLDQQQQQHSNHPPQLATQIPADLLFSITMQCRYVGLLMAFHCAQPGVAAALYPAVQAAARLSVLWLQRTISGKVEFGGEEFMLRHALTSSYETVMFAGYVQRLTDGYSASSSSSSSNGWGGTSSTPCSANSGACKEYSILADTAVLRLQFMLLAVYTRAICEKAPSRSNNRHSSSKQGLPQQVQATAATESAPRQPHSLLQLSEELWAVSLQHNPQQQQQQQQSLPCLQLLADTLQSERCLKRFGPPAERLQELMGHAAASLNAVVRALPTSSSTDELHLSSSSKGRDVNGSSSSSSSEHQKLQQLLQQSSWVLWPLFLAIGAKYRDEGVKWIPVVVQGVRSSTIAWDRTANTQWQSTYNEVLAAFQRAKDAQAAVVASSQAAGGGCVTEGSAAPAAPTAAGSVPGVVREVVEVEATAAAAGPEAEDAGCAITSF